MVSFWKGPFFYSFLQPNFKKDFLIELNRILQGIVLLF